MTSPRIALFGGSFNPPHIAHQLVCLWALATNRADEVWLTPCFEHAFDKALVAFEHRLEMCRLAATLLPPDGVRVCAVEGEIGGRSRTFVTVEELQRRHPSHRFALLVGADLLQETSAWYRFDELRAMVDLLVVGRPGYPGPEGAIELSPLSSTEVRGRLAAGSDVSSLVSANVLSYIERHGLYR